MADEPILIAPVVQHIQEQPAIEALQHDQSRLATAEEIRTPALWGLRFRKPFLHDGSEATYAGVIRRHDKEASTSRRIFDSLPDSQKAAVVAFLGSL